MKLNNWQDYVGIIVILLILALVAPPILLLINFGFGLPPTIEKWGQIGSFIGGVYSAILSALTLIFLLGQTQVMKRQTKLQEKFFQLEKENASMAIIEKEAQSIIGLLDLYIEDITNLKTDEIPNFVKNKFTVKDIILLIDEEDPADLSPLLYKVALSWSTIYQELIRLGLNKHRVQNEPVHLLRFINIPFTKFGGQDLCYKLDLLLHHLSKIESSYTFFYVPKYS